MKWKRDSLVLLIVTIAVFGVYGFYIFFGFSYIDKKEKEEDDAINMYWADKCYAQVVNNTNHKVAITMYGHENGQVVTMGCQVMAGQQVMLKEDMVRDEVREFPPEGMADSALIVFDDTLNYWQIPALDRASVADRHSLYDKFHWELSDIVVREEQSRGGYRPCLYRNGKEFVLTDHDYERALGIKRYRGQIFHENN